MTLTGGGGDRAELTQIGSMLYTRCVSGTRVIAPGETKVIAGHQFDGEMAFLLCPVFSVNIVRL